MMMFATRYAQYAHYYCLLLLLLLLLLLIVSRKEQVVVVLEVKALSPYQGSVVPHSYKIVGIPGGTGTQLLPASYVNSFSRWTLLDDDGDGNEQQRLCPSASAKEATATTSSSGSSSLRIRPTLDVLVKGGVPSYVMAGIQVSNSNGGGSNNSKATTTTTDLLLLAQQWTTFAMAVEPNFRLVLYVGPSDGATDERLCFVDSTQIRNVIERLGVLLSQSSSAAATDELSNGFHIITVPLKQSEGWITLDNTKDDDEILTCLLTAEPDARELFTLDQDLVEMTVTSSLQVPVKELLIDNDGVCGGSQQ